MSADALQLYKAIARSQWDTVDQITAENPTAKSDLAAWGLIDDYAGRPVVREPRQALRNKLEQDLAEAAQRVARMASIPALAAQLGREYQQIQMRAGSSSVYLSDPAMVNARLQDIVAGARREILAAQPGGPRSRDLLQLAVDRDAAALDRGVSMRTIYRDTVRDHAVTAEYARTMSARPDGRPAQYRTMVGDFERMIIVDRENAFVSDHIVEGSPPHSAWLVSDPAVVAVLARVFDNNWRRAQPWTGELRPTRGRRTLDTVTSADGVRTNSRQRGILRYLCSGASQAKIANRIGISLRKLTEEITVLKGLWGVHSLTELIYQYALSPDRLVDDSEGLAAAAASSATAVQAAAREAVRAATGATEEHERATEDALT